MREEKKVLAEDLKEYLFAPIDPKQPKVPLINIYFNDPTCFNKLKKGKKINKEVIDFFEVKAKKLALTEKISVDAFRKLKWGQLVDEYVEQLDESHFQKREEENPKGPTTRQTEKSEKVTRFTQTNKKILNLHNAPHETLAQRDRPKKTHAELVTEYLEQRKKEMFQEEQEKQERLSRKRAIRQGESTKKVNIPQEESAPQEKANSEKTVVTLNNFENFGSLYKYIFGKKINAVPLITVYLFAPKSFLKVKNAGLIDPQVSSFFAIMGAKIKAVVTLPKEQRHPYIRNIVNEYNDVEHKEITSSSDDQSGTFSANSTPPLIKSNSSIFLFEEKRKLLTIDNNIWDKSNKIQTCALYADLPPVVCSWCLGILEETQIKVKKGIYSALYCPRCYSYYLFSKIYFAHKQKFDKIIVTTWESLRLDKQIGNKQNQLPSHLKPATGSIPIVGRDNNQITKREVTYKNFIVRRNTFHCRYERHQMQNIDAIVTITDGHGGIQKVKIPAAFCPQCNIYVIMEDTYQKISRTGKFLCRVYDEYKYMNSFTGYEMDGLASESILKICGYSVSETDGLSESTRHDILARIVDNNILTRTEIVSYLKFFIRLRENSSSFYFAVKKWNNDIEFISNYKVGQYRMQEVGSITRTAYVKR